MSSLVIHQLFLIRVREQRAENDDKHKKKRKHALLNR